MLNYIIFRIKVISSEQIDNFFAAKSLDEQNIAFKQFPLDQLKTLFRYATSCMLIKTLQQNICNGQTAIFIVHCRWYHGKEQIMKNGRSEAQFKYVEASDGTVGEFFIKRFMQVCQTVPIWDNYYMSIYMRGQRGYNPASKPALTLPYLTRDGFTKLKVSTVLP